MNTTYQKVEKLLSNLIVLKPKTVNVVLMPDFFLDRFISFGEGIKRFYRRISEVANRKGGSLDGVAQVDFRGGNAFNTAAALALLGVKVFPLLCTDELGLNLLKWHFKPLKVDLSYSKVRDSASITTALEFPYRKERRNVMLRNLGSLEQFSCRDLGEEDYKLLERASYVCVFNWAGTRSHGTELAETVFRYVKARGKGKTYFDTADPLPNEPKIPELVERVLVPNDLVDILSLNENEAITYAKYIASRNAAKLLKKCSSKPALAKECARILAKKLACRIDLHTTTYSATFTSHEETLIPAFKVNTLRATGAGDAWNAGNIYANINNFPTDLRLTFANATAAYYLSNLTGKHPTFVELQGFLQEILNSSEKNPL